MNHEPRELPIQKVGRQVFFSETNEQISRTGEGAFLRLKDGTIMHAYTEYAGPGYHDHDPANIVAIFSHDEGETWAEKKLLVAKDAASVNVMSVSLQRLQNGEILLVYLRKIKENIEGAERVLCRVTIRRSTDECQTWSEPLDAYDDKHHSNVLNNDRVLQMQSGKLIIPIARYDMTQERPTGKLMFILSKDNGHTWYDSGNLLKMPFENRRGYEEPGLYQHEDGTLWCYARTNLGCQFCLFSNDEGITWTTPAPNIFFTGARSPMLVKKVMGKYTLAIFNPISLYTGRNIGNLRGRAPFLMAVSETDGIGHDANAFLKLYYLEDDMDNDYCYPAVIDGEDYFLVAYYHSNGREKPLNNLKITKVSKDEIAK